MHRRLCSSLPPGPPAPAIVQALRFARDPFGFLTDCSAQYGDLFTLNLPGQPPIVVTSAPELVRQCFALRPTLPRRPQPTQPDSSNCSHQNANLWVSHWRYRDLVEARTAPPCRYEWSIVKHESHVRERVTQFFQRAPRTFLSHHV